MKGGELLGEKTPDVVAGIKGVFVPSAKTSSATFVKCISEYTAKKEKYC